MSVVYHLCLLILALGFGLLQGCGDDSSTSTFAVSTETIEINAIAENLNVPVGLGIDLDSETYRNQIFVALFGSSQVIAIDEAGVITQITNVNLAGPTNILIDLIPHSMMVTESQTNQISRVDFNTLPGSVTVAATLPQGVFAIDIASNIEFRYVAARNTTRPNADAIYNISTNSPRLIAEGFSQIGGIAFRQINEGRETELLVSDTRANTIYRINFSRLRENQVLTSFSRFLVNLDGPTDIAIDPDTDFVYYLERGSNQVRRSRAKGGETTLVAQIEEPNALLFGPNRELFVSSSTGKVFRVTGF